MNIHELITYARSRGASDIHMSALSRPMFRVDGAILPMEGTGKLTQDEMEGIFRELTSATDRRTLDEEKELDFAFDLPGNIRLRCNGAIQRGTISLALRMIPDEIQTLEQLGLPVICEELCMKHSGLIVISGPTGSGKSTTLAAMIDHMNHHQRRRIVTIEDPVEQVFSDDQCSIIQRELGSDTRSYAQALKHVLRQDPDIIMIGEMRDQDTAAAAIAIAETGHLVLTTGHAPSSPQAVERIIDLFPMDERQFAQNRLASVVVAILCQTLVPRADGKGRAAGVEVMLGNAPVRNLIREGKVHQLSNVIRTSKREGMQTLDQALVGLFRESHITRQCLFEHTSDAKETEGLVGEVSSEPTHALQGLGPVLAMAAR